MKKLLLAGLMLSLTGCGRGIPLPRALPVKVVPLPRAVKPPVPVRPAPALAEVRPPQPVVSRIHPEARGAAGAKAAEDNWRLRHLHVPHLPPRQQEKDRP